PHDRFQFGGALALALLAPPQRLLGPLALGDVDADAHVGSVGEADVGPRRFDGAAAPRAHPNVHPSLARVHEPADILAIFRIGIALLHQRNAGRLPRGPADDALELRVQPEHTGVRFVARDHDGDGVDNRPQQLLLAGQRLAADVAGPQRLDLAGQFGVGVGQGVFRLFAGGDLMLELVGAVHRQRLGY